MVFRSVSSFILQVLDDVNLGEETKKANKEEEAHRHRLLKKKKEVRSIKNETRVYSQQKFLQSAGITALSTKYCLIITIITNKYNITKIY